jgi:hypothetical protein
MTMSSDTANKIQILNVVGEAWKDDVFTLKKP